MGFTNKEHRDYESCVAALTAIKELSAYFKSRQGDEGIRRVCVTTDDLDEKSLSYIKMAVNKGVKGILTKTAVNLDLSAGTLQISVLAGRDIPAISKAKSKNVSTFVEISFNRKVYTTAAIKRDSNPKWKEEIFLYVERNHSEASDFLFPGPFLPLSLRTPKARLRRFWYRSGAQSFSEKKRLEASNLELSRSWKVQSFLLRRKKPSLSIYPQKYGLPSLLRTRNFVQETNLTRRPKNCALNIRKSLP